MNSTRKKQKIENYNILKQQAKRNAVTQKNKSHMQIMVRRRCCKRNACIIDGYIPSGFHRAWTSACSWTWWRQLHLQQQDGSAASPLLSPSQFRQIPSLKNARFFSSFFVLFSNEITTTKFKNTTKELLFDQTEAP